jgi:hypothetical protein
MKTSIIVQLFFLALISFNTLANVSPSKQETIDYIEEKCKFVTDEAKHSCTLNNDVITIKYTEVESEYGHVERSYNGVYTYQVTIKIPLYLVDFKEHSRESVAFRCGSSGSCTTYTCKFTTTAKNRKKACEFLNGKKHFALMYSTTPERLINSLNHYKKQFSTNIDTDPFK